MFQAVLSNPSHPEYGVATIPFPIPRDQYAHCMELLEALEIGDAVKADCKVEKIDSFYTVLKRTEMLTVNVEELNYLAKRLDSFDTGEAAQFQAMAHKLELFQLKDLINLTFCCQQATVITDFSDLAAIGRDHYMNLHGGSASVDELNALDGKETARQLIESGSGTITPYGVVYDNGMKLEQVYDVRMDFGRSGNEFWHTWWPRGPEELNSPVFKAELQEVVDTLRESVLKGRFAMERFCYARGGKISGGWTQNYGYIVETEHYRYCLRCNPSPGDYNGYLTAYDLDVQRQNMARDKPLVGRVTYANGDAQEFTSADEFLRCVREELPYRPTTGFHYEVLTNDPAVRKAVDDMAYDFYGEENPRQLDDYQNPPEPGMTFGGM